MANLKVVAVPDLKLDISEGQSLDFKAVLRWLLATSQQYNTDSHGIRAAVRLEGHIEAIEMGADLFVLDNEDWNRLKSAIEAPVGGYPIRPASRMLPFVDAVVDAKDK